MNLNLLYRFDLFIKFLYIYAYDKKLQTDFFKNMYISHFQCINNFTELVDWPNENSVKDKDKCVFFFNKLIENIKINGFDKKFGIPVGNNDIIVNGAHRFITCYYFNKIMIFKKLNKKGCLGYDYNFFLNRQNTVPICNAGPNLKIKYGDVSTLEAIKHLKNIRTMILFPNSYKEDDSSLKNIIEQYGYVYYKKKIKLNKTGLNNLIKSCYRGEKWIGGLFPTTKHAELKTTLCYGDNYTTIYIIHMNDVNKTVDMKNKCRLLFNKEKNSLHMTDFQKDTFRVASTLLNDNSIHFLNNKKKAISNKMQQYLNIYFQKVSEINKDDFCVTSSGILDMYGLRESNDIDYLHYSDLEIGLKYISPHKEKWLSYYHTHKHDIIYNPENYFYFNGFKFASMDCIKKMKESRNEKKDINDISLINSL